MYFELNKGKKNGGPGIITKLFSWLGKILGDIISKLVVYIIIIVVLYILAKRFMYI